MSYLVKNYNRKKISFTKGKGSYLFTSKGVKYLDFVQGIAVNSLGHAHPKLVNIINKQSKKLWHVSNAFQIPEGEILAKKLVKKHLQILLCFKIVVLKPQRLQLKLQEDIFIQLANLIKTEFYVSKIHFMAELWPQFLQADQKK